MDSKSIRKQARSKKDEYINQISKEQREFIERKISNANQQLQPQQSCCFGIFKSRQHNKTRRDSARQEAPTLYKSECNDWIQYLSKQVENYLDSSSYTYLGFNWADSLYQYIQMSQNSFSVQKYRSALFYLNYSIRHISTKSFECDQEKLIRKITRINKKLAKLDGYPTDQNFMVDILQSQVPSSNHKKTESSNTISTANKNQEQSLVNSKNTPTIKMSSTHRSKEQSMLSFIYQDVNRVKMIDDFNAPLSNIDKILQSILIQMRTNLNEVDHPIHLIVSKFQEIMTWHINKKKDQFMSYMQTRSQTQNQSTKRFETNESDQFEVIDPDKEESKDKRTTTQQRIRQTRRNLRATYDRQTLNQLPHEVQFAEICISEVKKFVCMMYGTLIRFYLPVMNFDDLHQMREDLIELLTSLTVKGELSRLLLELCRLSTKEEEVLLEQRFTEFVKVKPEEIGIDRLFTLNNSSVLVELFVKQQQIEKEQQLNGDVGGSIVMEQDEGQTYSMMHLKEESFITTKDNKLETSINQFQNDTRSKSVVNSPLVIKKKQNQSRDTQLFKTARDTQPNQQQPQQFKLTRDLLKQRLKQKPFMNAISNLRSIKDYDTPINKMRIISQTSSCIVQDIDQFWKDIPLVEKKKLTLDADQLLMIFIFVTLRSKVTEMYAHLKLINEFSTDTIRQSKLGYYGSTLEVALQQLINFDKDHLVNQRSFKYINNADSMINKNLKVSMITDLPLVIEEGGFDFIEKNNQLNNRLTTDNVSYQSANFYDETSIVQRTKIKQ